MGAEPMILVVDHYDSFTYNLVQLVESLGHPTTVVRSDERPAGGARGDGAGRGDPVARARATRATPGASPSCSTCSRTRRRCWASAWDIRRSVWRPAAPSTGRRPSTARPRSCSTRAPGILEGVAVPFEAGRYHSLVVERDDLPDELELTAWTEDGLVMGTQHRELPRFGVQFHPESILTPEGPRIVENFLALTALGRGAAGAVRERRRARSPPGTPRRRPPGTRRAGTCFSWSRSAFVHASSTVPWKYQSLRCRPRSARTS